LSGGDQFYDLAKEDGVAENRPNSTGYSLPNGLFLNNRDKGAGDGEGMVYMTMLGTANTSNTVAMGHIDTLIWSQSIIKVDGTRESTRKWPNYEVHSSECALYYCVRNYTAVVRNATLVETSSVLEDQQRVPGSWAVNDTQVKGLAEVVVQSLTFHPVESRIQRTDLQLANGEVETGWNVSQQAVNGIGAFMQKTFAACLRRDTENCTQVLDSWVPVNGFLVAGSNEQYEPSIAKVLWDSKDINGTFENIAMSMSNAIRNGADNAKTKDGLLGIPTTVYAVDWRWISLHGIVELASLAFLFLTILATLREKNGRVPVWKSSELAVLSRGHIVGESLRGARTIDELEEKAKAVSVVMVNGRNELGDDQSLPLVDTGADPRMAHVSNTSVNEWQYGHADTSPAHHASHGTNPYNGGEVDTPQSADTTYTSTTDPSTAYPSMPFHGQDAGPK